MTVSSEVTKSGPYVGNGVTTVFPYAFRILEDAHIQVVQTENGIDTVLVSGFSVSGKGEDAGGNITFDVAPTASKTITLVRNAPLTQSTDLENQGAYYAQSIEDALDLAAMRDQQLQEQIDRSVKIPITTNSGISTDLPLPEANTLIGWNEGGDKLKNINTSTLATRLATIVAFGTMNADTFTGDGATKIFALTANPGVQANLDVSVDGFTKIPGVDYIWSAGKVVTFPTAPVIGAKILARYSLVLPQGASTVASAVTTNFGVSLGRLLTLNAGTVAQLLADTTLTYDGVSTGDVINAAGFRYQVAASSALDYHVKTSGGIKLYVQGCNGYDIRAFGAIGDGVTNDTSAILAVLNSNADRIYFPAGTYLTNTIRINSTNDGCVIYGDGQSTVIKPNSGSYGLHIEGTAGVSYITKFAIRDLKIDMSLMSDLVTVAGIYQRRAYGGTVDNVEISGWGANNRAVLLKEGAYTTTYSNCTFGAGGSKVEMSGLSVVDQVTTINFVNCDGDAVIAHLAAHCNFNGFTLQGSQVHFQLNQVREFNINGCDIEGSGDYMSCTANTISVISIGNSFSGSSGGYRPTILPNTNYVFMDGSKQIFIQDGSSYLKINNTGFGNLVIAGAGSGTTPKLEVFTAESQSNAAYQAYFHNDFVGTSANGLRLNVAKNGKDVKVLTVQGNSNTILDILGGGIWQIFEPNNNDIGAVSPTAGSVYFWYDNTAKSFKYKDSSGTVRTITAV